MSFAAISSLIAGQLPLELPGYRINGIVLSETLLAIDLTDDPGTPFEDRYELQVTGSFTLSGTVFGLGAITGVALAQLDGLGAPIQGQTITIEFLKGGSLDAGSIDLSSPSAVLNTPLFGDALIQQLTRGIDAQATQLEDWLTGTDFRDIFRMFGGDDVVEAGGGNDRILAGSGDDIVLAGSGNDDVMAGSGNDLIFGEGGADSVQAGRGRDAVLLGNGDDTAQGGAGNDMLLGQGGDDVLVGGRGNDLLVGGGGSNRMAGGAGSDGLVAGGTGIDYLDGGKGRDVLVSGGDFTFMQGGEGADVFVFKDSDSDVQVISVLDFEDGVDRIGVNRGQLEFIRQELDNPSSVFIQDVVGSNMVRLSIGEDTMFLAGITRVDLSAADFVKTYSAFVRDVLDDSGWDTELDPLLFG